MADDFNPQPSSELTRKEKLGFVGLVILAILIIYLGFRQMGNSIKGPFAAKLASRPPAAEELSSAAQQELLKQKDTDKDGLSDYDELYLYSTSPYLADTDSDGVTDKEEIEKGADPNCPTGKDCGAEIVNPAGAAKTTATIVSPIASIPSVDQILLQVLFGEKPDPQLLREFLTKQGMDKKTLDLFNDEELINIFKETVSATSTAAALAPLVLPQLEQMKPEDWRKLLIEQGVSAEALKKISDQELMEMVKEVK